MRSRCPRCRGRDRGPCLCGPARHVSSAPARRSSSGRYGAAVDDDPGRAVAPLHADLAARAREVQPLVRRPVRERVLRRPRSARASAATSRASSIGDSLEERELVRDGAVRGAEHTLRVGALPTCCVQRPSLVAAAANLVGALRPRVAPAFLARPRVHRVRDEHRSGRAPHELVRFVRTRSRARARRVGRRARRSVRGDTPRSAFPASPKNRLVVRLVRPAS